MKNLFLCLVTGLVLFANVNAQNQRREPTPGDTLVSPKVMVDSRVVFSLYAPKAGLVRLTGGDIPGIMQGLDLAKREDGVWHATVGPLAPGAYRYNFSLDGVAVFDPRNTAVSESNMNIWSLVYVPGAEFMDAQQVPHGAVAEITYFSNALKKFRRMHVYTPPGYENGKDKYPVFFLLHGAFDCDDSWTTVGRAGFILDNLIAAGKAKPMVVVMPAGHTSPFRFGPRALDNAVDEFKEDFLKDIVPYIDSHYRVAADFKNRAIAGLSMGGAQSLNLADHFAYIGVFSSGIFGITGGNPNQPAGPSWEEQHKAFLENADLKKKIKLVWFATGTDDFLIETSRATVELFRKYDFPVTYKETTGGHTWANWRDYLNEYAPLLFQ